MRHDQGFDISKLRKRLEDVTGPNFWRSLDEVAETEEFKEFLAHEYPYGAQHSADENGNPMSRGEFMSLLGASLLLLTGLPGCKPQPKERIVPYAKQPEELVPGKPLFFATSMVVNGHATGLLAESHMGRPTKLEGNPSHPDSLGATSALHQAAILSLYDPDRAKIVKHAGSISTWGAFATAMESALKQQTVNNGRGLRILTERIVSPTAARQLQEILTQYPQAKWHQYEPVNRDAARRAQRAVFGRYVDPQYHLAKARVVVSLDGDLFHHAPGSLRHTRQFVAQRNLLASNGSSGARDMGRLYVAESCPSVTGSIADHRIALRASDIAAAAALLAQRLGVKIDATLPKVEAHGLDAWLDAAARDLAAHKGAGLVVAGEEQPAVVHALAHAMNRVLQNDSKTVSYIDPIEHAAGDNAASLKELVDDMARGDVDLLFLLGGNPAYDAPADFDFSVHAQRVALRVRLSAYEDETSKLCHWQIPQTHFLEEFSDARASDGTISMVQPIIEPLYKGKSIHEMLAVLLNAPYMAGYDIVKQSWKHALSGAADAAGRAGAAGLPGLPGFSDAEFERRWRKALHDGIWPDTESARLSVTAKTSFNGSDLAALGGLPTAQSAEHAAGRIELVLKPDPMIWDGRFANNGWLQETPKPLTKLTWDNAALLSPALAERLGVSNERVLKITANGRTIHAPTWILPGHADHSITLHLGYGRDFTGRVGSGRGVSVYPLRASRAMSIITEADVSATSRRYALATTQHHHSMEGRELIRHAPIQQFLAQPDFAQRVKHGSSEHVTFYPKHEQTSDYAWGMAINLSACTGCNACVVACQAENNVPVVGKEEVRRGREMHWIRIDRYFEGGLDNPEIHHQPVMCMHCENAPCEPVCPVGATVHSDEGLNEMVYNRCVGTRYCSNNCPYKVRRFNFFQYADKKTESLKLGYNPDVTVRNRGVMEKCTFCVQRINQARITAKKENRQIRDGEVQTACQSVCPAQAITFGNLLDAESAVAKTKQSPLNYGLLTELNTQPRLTYLAKVSNPNPSVNTLPVRQEPHREGAHHG